jgi:hypothetical protein
MSLHNSDNEEVEVVDVSNSEAGPSAVCKPTGDIAASKRKYTKKRKVDEVDFSIITILESLECLSLTMLTLANFWKTFDRYFERSRE